MSSSRVLAVLLLTYTLNLVDRQLFGFLAVPIKADLGLTDTQLGLLGGLAFALLYAVAGVPIAWLADRTSRSRIIAISVAVWSAFTALSGVAQSFAQLFIARLGVGIGEAGGTAPAHALISAYFPTERRARAMAIYSLGVPLGAAAGIMLGGWIADGLNWRAAFLVVGVAGVVLAPLVYWSVPEPAKNLGDTPALRPGAKATALTIMRTRSFWLLSLGTAAGGIPSAGILFWLPTFLHRSHGLTLIEVSRFQGSLMLVGGVAGTLLGGWLADRLGRAGKAAYALVPAAAFLLMAPAFALAVFSTSLPLTWLLLLVWQTLAPVWLAPIFTAVQHIVPPTMRSTASASFSLANNLVGTGLGTLILGMLSDAFTSRAGSGALGQAMLISLSGYLVAFVLILFATRTLPREWQAEPASSEIPR